jgi:thiol:disulfide interchange protein
MCCALAALLFAALAAWQRLSRTALHWRPRARWVAAALALAVATAAGSALAAHHLGHYEARAAANDRSLLAEIWAQPICSGNASNGHASVRAPAYLARR